MNSNSYFYHKNKSNESHSSTLFLFKRVSLMPIFLQNKIYALNVILRIDIVKTKLLSGHNFFSLLNRLIFVIVFAKFHFYKKIQMWSKFKKMIEWFWAIVLTFSSTELIAESLKTVNVQCSALLWHLNEKTIHGHLNCIEVLCWIMNV